MSHVKVEVLEVEFHFRTMLLIVDGRMNFMLCGASEEQRSNATLKTGLID
jgi:hypothetical protein